MRVWRILAAVPMAVMLLAAAPTGSLWAAPPAQQNLLTNAGFEGAFNQFANFRTAIMAEYWSPWWRPQAAGDPNWKSRMPEYKAAAPYSNRIHSGANAQQLFTFYGTHIGGIYQRAQGVTPGSRLRFTIWGQAWAGERDDPYKTESGGPMHMRIGIDPTGGTDPFSASIVWSEDKNPLDKWEPFAVEATARASRVTVYTWSAPEYPTKHNDAYWDDASLTTVASPPPVADTPRAYSTPTRAPRTVTPTPTVTGTPTNTPTPTPVHTATPTVTPTHTVTPTPVTGSVCVLAYDDRNGNRIRDLGEPLLSDAVLTLSDAQQTVGTYSTNGLNEPFCFVGLQPVAYFVSEMNPSGYESTSRDSWSIALYNGATLDIEFGDRTTMEPPPTPRPTPVPSPTPVTLLTRLGSAVYGYIGLTAIVLALGVLVAFNAARRR